MYKLNPKNEFKRNVLTLMTGTTLAQAIPIAISPILTRIYTPEDFGIFALYMAVASIVSIIATGRYELAIMLPEKEEDAFSIVVLSTFIATSLSVLCLVIVLLFKDDLARLLGNPNLREWLYLLPASIFLTGMYQALNYWSNRNKKYKYMAVSKVSQSVGGGCAQLAMGFNAAVSGGLIVGSVFGQGVGVFVLLKMSWISFRNMWGQLSLSQIQSNAIKYKKFPLFSSWGALLDNAAVQIPIFMITQYFGAITTGFFSFTFKVLNIPMTLISSAFAQVLFQKISVMHQEQPDKLFSYVLRMFFVLLLSTTPLMLIMMVWGEDIFRVLFGAAWEQAGGFAAILSIAVAIRFAVSPLSSVLILEHNVKKGVSWQVTYFVTLTSTLLFFSGLPIESYLAVFVIHEVLLYGLYLYIILYAAKPLKKESI